jgi:predicted RNase H-like nuclease (RuvC/YqgF family)
LENKIEIIDGNTLNRTIESKHLGKTFRDVLSDFTEFNHNIDNAYETVLDKAAKDRLDKAKFELFKLASSSEDDKITIIKLSNIIIKLAAKYTEDIFLKKKTKDVIEEIKDLKDELSQIKKIIDEVKSKL